jgi:hypothetical protein
MSNEQPDPDWLKRPPAEGDDAQWFKEQSQANRRAKFRSRGQRGNDSLPRPCPSQNADDSACSSP